MERWFVFFYSFFVTLLYIIALPFLVLFSLKQKYRYAIPARFFLKDNPPLAPHGIWFHVCSFGESKAIKPIVDAFPMEMLRMSATTHTGYKAIGEYTLKRAYLPFEPLLFGWVQSQKVLVVMEAEFWYLLFLLAQKRGAKTLLINARISDSSYEKYRRMRWLYKQIFKHIDEVYAQTEQDKERLQFLGAKYVRVIGNIKLSGLRGALRNLAKPSGIIVCAASIHEGEEALILDAYSDFKRRYGDAKLIIVPRHPERFEKVAKMIETFSDKENLSWHLYTQKRDFESNIVLVDMLGELVNIYAISDIVILGGAFEPKGGHNAAEAAQFGCKIISGPHYFNQRDIFGAIGGIDIVDAKDLSIRLQQYRELQPTQIKTKTDISPIIMSIKDAIMR